MNKRLIELAERRATLEARAESERAELSQALASWRGSLKAAEGGWAVVRFIRSHVALLTAVGALVPLRRWRTAKWAQRGLMLWGIVRVIKRILRG